MKKESIIQIHVAWKTLDTIALQSFLQLFLVESNFVPDEGFPARKKLFGDGLGYQNEASESVKSLAIYIVVTVMNAYGRPGSALEVW